MVKEVFGCDDKVRAETSGDDETAVIAHDGFKGDDPGTLLYPGFRFGAFPACLSCIKPLIPAHRCVEQ
jgi:hypothetical protein